MGHSLSFCALNTKGILSYRVQIVQCTNLKCTVEDLLHMYSLVWLPLPWAFTGVSWVTSLPLYHPCVAIPLESTSSSRPAPNTLQGDPNLPVAFSHCPLSVCLLSSCPGLVPNPLLSLSLPKCLFSCKKTLASILRNFSWFLPRPPFSQNEPFFLLPTCLFPQLVPSVSM